MSAAGWLDVAAMTVGAVLVLAVLQLVSRIKRVRDVQGVRWIVQLGRADAHGWATAIDLAPWHWFSDRTLTARITDTTSGRDN